MSWQDAPIVSDWETAPVVSGEPQSADGPSAGRRLRFGLEDTIVGGAQLLTQMLPRGVIEAGNQFNNWLADNTGLVGRLPAGGVDQQAREREAAYQAERQAGGQSGVDWWRIAGNVVNPVNIALGAAAPVAAASLPARMAAGAATGAVAGSLAPVTTGDEFWEDKAKQTATGGVFGAAVPAVAAGIGRVISPRASTNPDVRALSAAGVKPTVGQTLGGWANRAEEKAMSVPILGDMIGAARNRANEQLNRAVAQRALEPIGAKLPKDIGGRELVAKVSDTLGDAYDDVLKGLTVQADGKFASDVASLRQMVNTGSINPNIAGTFNRILQNDVLSKFKGKNVLTGQTLKDIESDLGQMAARYGQSPDPDAQLLADALREVQSSLRGMVARSNPAVADRIKAINTGWANYKRLERAASYVGAEEGAFNASQLQSAVKALDRTKDKGGFAKGRAFMQDLSDPAKNVLGGKVPNSGTADRMFLGGAGLGAAYVEPATLAIPLLGSAAYSPWGQSLLRGAVSSRPAFAEPVAGLLNQASPMLAPAGGLLGVEVLKQ